MATERRVSWILTANIRNWQKNLDKAQRRMDRFGRKMQRAGRSLTRNLTMPLGAAAGASLKMASDFQSSLSQAQSQAALTAQQVTFIGDAAKRTAIRTGESTDDIIEAYKFTISAGKNLAESQEIVSAAAEASAAGFGIQRDLVRAATTALEAYSSRLDSGREFMDLLVGSAQVMELEVSKLSSAMQRNVGVADNLGIGLDELLASIGSVSEIMGDAQRGGRSMAAMLNSLLSPSAEAKDAISGVFGSLSNMRRALREEGLLKVMLRLRDRLEEASEEGLGLIFSQRALEAALNLTNNEGERTNEILRNMGSTAGATKGAFDAVSDSTERNFKQALQSLKVTAIELGEIMIPIANKIIDSVRQILQRFRDLSRGAKVNVLKIAGLLAAGGPLLLAFGTLVRAVATMVGIINAKFMVITGAFVATVTAGQWLVDNWENIMNIMAQQVKSWARATNNAFSFVLKTISFFGRAMPTTVGAQFAAMDAMILQLQGLGEDASTSLTTFGESGANAFGKIQDAMKGMFDTMTQGTALGDFMDFVTGVGDGGGFGFSDIDTGGKQQSTMDLIGIPDIGSIAEDYTSNLDDMRANTKEFGTVTEEALGDVGGFWNDFTKNFKSVGQSFSRFIANQMTNAISSFSQTVGTMFSGADDGMRTAFEKVIGIVLDFAKRLGQILIAIGSAMAFTGILSGPGGAYIAAGSALVALSTGFQRGIGKRAENRENRQETNVNDALIRSDGSIVNFHPNDDILASKNLGGVISGMGGGQVINNQLNLDGRVVWENQRRVNTNKRR